MRECPVPIAGTDTRRRILYCNPAFERTFLYSAADANGRTIEELLGADPARARRGDGAVIDVDVRVTEETADGVCIGYLCFFVDVTSQRETARALQIAEAKFASVFRASSASVSLSQAGTGRFIDVNDTWVRLTGYAREDVVGRTPLEVGLVADPEEFRRLNQIARAQGGSVRNFECHKRTKNGEIITTSLSLEEFDAGGDALRVVIAQDLTPIRTSEARLSEVSRKLLDAQELERLRIGRELHDDIGQRLALLQLSMSELESDRALPARTRERVRELVEHVAELARDVRAVSHELYSPQVRLLDLPLALRNLCADLEKHLGMDIAFSSHTVPSPVPADVSLCLFRVLQEGLTNAARHSDTRRVDVELWGSPVLLHLNIRDFGSGFVVGATREGLGLLSMRERVHMVGGTFSIRSTPAVGTELNVRIPLIPVTPPRT